MKLTLKLAMAAAIAAVPMTAQAGIIATTATASLDQTTTFTLEGGANFVGFQNGLTALHDAVLGDASLSGSSSEMWSAGCEGGQTCTLDISNSVTANANDGSAVSKRFDGQRKLFIQVEDMATLTVNADLVDFFTDAMVGDGKVPSAAAGVVSNQFVLDEDMIRVMPTLLSVQTIMTVPLAPTFPAEFSLDEGENMSFDLPFGAYSIAVSGGFLEVSAQQGGIAVPVSEPATLALFGLALAGLASVSRRKNKCAA